jgi:purine-nucleoside phosphorylase
MEAAGLYGLAAERGARALAVLTVTDLVLQDEAMTSDERERSLGEMVDIALDALHRDSARSGEPAGPGEG